MIGYLRGTLVSKHPPTLLLDVGGVGYEVDVPMSTFFKLPAIGENLQILTHMLVREDAHSLVGFLSEGERALFRSLIRVSGVGAKLALAILSGISAEEFARCIHQGDISSLVRLPGIGKKTAERLVVELRDRLPGTDGAEMALTGGGFAVADASPVQEAISALISLGFKPQEAQTMIRALPATGKSSEDLIRLALQGAAKS
jgi:Holliday junction DNA helicase RuvA